MEKKGNIYDNQKYIFENKTGKAVPIREVMTPQANKLRNGIFDIDPNPMCQMKDTNRVLCLSVSPQDLPRVTKKMLHEHYNRYEGWDPEQLSEESLIVDTTFDEEFVNGRGEYRTIDPETLAQAKAPITKVQRG